MNDNVLSARAFSLFSCVDDDTHCFIVVKDGADGFTIFDALNNSDYIEALSCNRKATFLVDVQSFLDCAVIEVAYKEDCKLRDLMPIESVATAEIHMILEKLNDERR